MASDKIISTIGVPDEDVAHLRLLMRKAAGRLTHNWRWGTDTGANLLVIDKSGFEGQMALSRARVTGVRVAIICSEGESSDGEFALRRPLRLESVMEMLEQISAGTAALGLRPQASDEMLEASLRDAGLLLEDSSLPFEGEGVAGQRTADPEVAQGLEDFIRGNPDADPLVMSNLPRLDPNARIEKIDGQTAASSQRADRDRELIGTPLGEPRALRRTLDGEPAAGHRLREYLDGNLLLGPAQIAWPDAGVLSLDPKQKVYHCAEPLAELEIYCRKRSKRGDWRRLTTAELNALRSSQPAQPYEKLVWLDVLINSGGRLASHLDPGGTFQLVRWIDIAQDYPQYARITQAMMQPGRLHEIAAACNCAMDKVFAVTNAYDAIGCLKWTPRPPRHAEPAETGKAAKLLGRLRKPFGKR